MTFVPLQERHKKSSITRYLLIYACIASALLAGYGLVTLFSENAETEEYDEQYRQSKSYDYLLFTQQWPITYCALWREEATGERNCSFAKSKYAWTVHGIWPSKNGTLGPEFCRNIPFNMSVLAPIREELDEHWGTIQENGEYMFLRHEWTKHGTCAVDISELKTELDYFSTGLAWNKKYDIYGALEASGILPSDDSSYRLADVYKSINEHFGFKPELACYKDKSQPKYLLMEVRFCLTKELSLMDCMDESDMVCESDEVYYPHSVPASSQ